ncbi:MAG: hypothetical protein MPJ82_00040 [Alphaproteobacteria bacterium]|nr:hypothetical protein [Alphaproteobacteria bacterium]MDA7989092.1 hypothetical protein [Alphaproteobacteria bacterium]MDA8008543.1 hypothetical protein [Alphaproteobacteria bacterium]MDA8031661.1 hypothetical protein [Alphaproteobacteria bacterium]
MSDITDNTEVRVVAERLKGHEDLCHERQRGIDRRFAEVDRRFDRVDRMLYFVIGLVVITGFLDVDLATAVEFIARWR